MPVFKGKLESQADVGFSICAAILATIPTPTPSKLPPVSGLGVLILVLYYLQILSPQNKAGHSHDSTVHSSSSLLFIQMGKMNHKMFGSIRAQETFFFHR